MKCILQGEVPSNDETVALFHLLSQANVDLRQPISLEEQLMEDSEMDADVGLAMVQLLKVCAGIPSLAPSTALQERMMLKTLRARTASWNLVTSKQHRA